MGRWQGVLQGGPADKRFVMKRTEQRRSSMVVSAPADISVYWDEDGSGKEMLKNGKEDRKCSIS